MQVQTDQKVLRNLAILVALRAKRYDVGLRTAFIQWTSAEEKKGVTYPEFQAYLVSQSVHYS